MTRGLSAAAGAASTSANTARKLNLSAGAIVISRERVESARARPLGRREHHQQHQILLDRMETVRQPGGDEQCVARGDRALRVAGGEARPTRDDVINLVLGMRRLRVGGPAR